MSCPALLEPDLESVAPSGRSVGETNKCIDTKSARTPVGSSGTRIYQAEPIAYRGSNLSPFLRISWNQMPGGEGTLPREWRQSASQRARNPPRLIRHTIYRTESIAYRGSNLSLFLRISWNQMPGGRGYPPEKRASQRLNARSVPAPSHPGGG